MTPTQAPTATPIGIRPQPSDNKYVFFEPPEDLKPGSCIARVEILVEEADDGLRFHPTMEFGCAASAYALSLVTATLEAAGDKLRDVTRAHHHAVTDQMSLINWTAKQYHTARQALAEQGFTAMLVEAEPAGTKPAPDPTQPAPAAAATPGTNHQFPTDPAEIETLRRYLVQNAFVRICQLSPTCNTDGLEQHCHANTAIFNRELDGYSTAETRDENAGRTAIMLQTTASAIITEQSMRRMNLAPTSERIAEIKARQEKITAAAVDAMAQMLPPLAELYGVTDTADLQQRATAVVTPMLHTAGHCPFTTPDAWARQEIALRAAVGAMIAVRHQLVTIPKYDAKADELLQINEDLNRQTITIDAATLTMLMTHAERNVQADQNATGITAAVTLAAIQTAREALLKLQTP